MIRQPPTYVPAAMDSPAAIFTHTGISNSFRLPFASSAKATIRDAACNPPEHPVDDNQQNESPGERDQRCEKSGNHDFVGEPVPKHAVLSRLGERCTDETTNESVRGARRKTEPPSQQIPCDGAE